MVRMVFDFVLQRAMPCYISRKIIKYSQSSERFNNIVIFNLEVGSFAAVANNLANPIDRGVDRSMVHTSKHIVYE